MADKDKETNRGIISRIDERTHFILNELINIDQHLNRLNERTGKAESSISRIKGIGIGVISVSSLIALILKIVGVY